MELALIAAIGKKNELGAGNELMWHLPKDFSWFIRNTKHKPVIMGRKTMESLGKPLKNRLNIVLTRTGSVADGFIASGNWDDAIATAQEWLTHQPELENANPTEGFAPIPNEIMVIGGGEIYQQAMDRVSRLYITSVDAEFPQADTFFPSIGPKWKLLYSESVLADEKHAFGFRFLVYERGSTI